MTGFIVLALYVGAFFIAYLAVSALYRAFFARIDYTALKTVTFGDESAVRPNRAASVLSVITIFLLWVAFTNSTLPLPQASSPYLGEVTFTYTSTLPDGRADDAEVTVLVYREDISQTVDAEGNPGRIPAAPEVEPGEGFAKNDSLVVPRYGYKVINVFGNDDMGRGEDAVITALNGTEVQAGETLKLPEGDLGLTDKGTPTFSPSTGNRMQRLYLPAPEVTVERFFELNEEGYRNYTLWQHTWISLQRVLLGFFFGALVGIPLGYAMGLTNWARGWFDPIVEFMRPVPPLALIPLMIIWFGIGEQSKVILLFLAALWIMAIAARAGVSGVAISKVHAAYSLGASKSQVLTKVIIPNSLPEIFTGARVAMGVCWGTVVAAELVAAERGLGMMIMVASKFQLTDIVIVGIILIGIIGFLIDVGIRMLEKWLVPWKGRV
ncbi:ABC transporter permease subunit [Roseovarius sp. SK2]|uniref:ABC transporter permease n=1 Tax=Roseovarius TaxID=74030 RepID=UPI00237AA822|nr:ABC transporter permease subunit [Roseovarius sp. SK2]MDD9725503.1 ABC transporter permease subunit [Roseovarius sp. SK2]